MAIELKMTGLCEGCPAAEPVFHKLNADGNTVEIITGCANSRICQHIERHLMKYMDEHPYTGPDPLELDI